MVTAVQCVPVTDGYCLEMCTHTHTLTHARTHIHTEIIIKVSSPCSKANVRYINKAKLTFQTVSLPQWIKLICKMQVSYVYHLSRQRQISCEFIQILFIYFINPFFYLCNFIFYSLVVLSLRVYVCNVTCDCLRVYMFTVFVHVYNFPCVHEDTNKLGLYVVWNSNTNLVSIVFSSR